MPPPSTPACAIISSAATCVATDHAYAAACAEVQDQPLATEVVLVERRTPAFVDFRRLTSGFRRTRSTEPALPMVRAGRAKIAREMAIQGASADAYSNGSCCKAISLRS